MRHLSAPFVLVLVLAVAAGPVFAAQATTGSISGVVRDASGAVMPGAAVTVTSAVTKSGTNRLRGSVFEFHRDSALDARGYFDTGDLPGFERDQFGGSLGGPIRRDSLFFFGAYEGLRERLAVTGPG